jgi:hypothetical protein
MKKMLLGSIAALALLAFPIAANPIIKVNPVGKSSFHPAKMHVALAGLGHGFEKGKHKGEFGFCGLKHETGSVKDDVTPPTSSSDYKPADYRIPEVTGTSDNPGPVSNAQPVPEPSTLAMFGLFAVFLALRTRWATWHR